LKVTHNIQKRIIISSQLIIVFLVFILGSHQLMAQSKNFSGSYLLGGQFKGKAVFDFQLQGRDTIFTNDFYFHSSIPLVDNPNAFKGLTYKGNFNKGKKNGEWSYQYKVFSPSENTEIDNRNIVFKVNGQEHSVYGKFSNGFADGNWKVIAQTIMESEPKDTTFYVNTSYKQGDMTGNLKGFSKGVSVQGAFDDEGLLHGEWVFKHQFNNSSQTIEEYRIYDKGIFKEHYFKIGRQKSAVKHIGLDVTKEKENEIWEEIPISDKYFKIIYLTNFGLENGAIDKLTSDSTRYFINHSNNFLKDALFSFGQHNERQIWELTPGSEPIKYARFKVRRYPFSDDDKKKLTDLSAKFNKVEDYIKNFFSDSQIDVSRHSYKELSFYFEVLGIYKLKMMRFKKLVDVITDPAFEYIDRNEIFPYLSPETSYPDFVKYQFKEEEFSQEFEFPQPFKSEECNLDLVYQHLNKIFEDIKLIESNTNKIVEKYKKFAKLREQENELVSKRDSVLSSFNLESEFSTYNDFHKEITTEIRELAEAKFRDYASLELEGKVLVVNEVIACFDEMILVYQELGDLPRKLNRLKEVYTRSVFNPYLQVYMDETVKERLFKAYENSLFPFLLSEFKSSLVCEKMGARAENFKLLYRKMVSLREQDTKELERQLRRVTKPMEILEILELKLNLE
jgi:hypothetical protein